MQSAISLSLYSPSPITRSGCIAATVANAYLCTQRSLRFCGLRRDVFESKSFNSLSVSTRLVPCSRDSSFEKVYAALQSNGKPSKGGFDYDLVIIGTGVGGHDAALHNVEKMIQIVSSLCCLLSKLRPVEIVKPAKLLSPETETVLLRHTRNPLVNELLPLSKFWDAEKTIREVKAIYWLIGDKSCFSALDKAIPHVSQSAVIIRFAMTKF